MKQNTECLFNTSLIVYILAYLNLQTQGLEERRIADIVLLFEDLTRRQWTKINLVTSSESLPAELELSVCKSDDVGG